MVEQPIKITFFSREHVLSFMKTELSNIYSSIGTCMDLDFEYVNRLAKPKRVNTQKHVP